MQPFNDAEVHVTEKLEKLGLAMCRKHGKLFSFRNDGQCKTCGQKLILADATAAPKPKRSRKSLAADAVSSGAPVSDVDAKPERVPRKPRVRKAKATPEAAA